MITAEMSAKGRATMATKWVPLASLKPAKPNGGQQRAAAFLKLRIGNYPKSKSHKVNRYVRFKAEQKACEGYLGEIQWQLKNRMFALSGSQLGEANRILDAGPLEAP